MKKLKEINKITLVVLIIIIIIILLLLGVIISTLTEKNGLISKIINGKLNIVEIAEEDMIIKTETTYCVNSINEDVMQITIKIKNVLGIEKIITPIGKEIMPQGYKKQIAIDYEVVSGNNYIFKVKVAGSDEIKEYILKADINAKPEFNQNESYLYPILTDYGVEINKTVEIDYGENINNYYSIDNGETWNKYTGILKLKSACTLIAKTVIEGEITVENKKEITLELASDALPTSCYDDSYETGSNKGVLYIDENVKGKNMLVSTYYYTDIYFYDENGVSISSTLINGNNIKVTIPTNTKYVSFSGRNGYPIYEVKIDNAPTIKQKKNYPTLTLDGIVDGYNEISIDYFSTTMQKLYKIDNENWKEYNDIISLKFGQQLLAKGIDKDGVESLITTYNSEAPSDAITPEWYDGDMSTGTSQGILYIDENVKGKNMLVSTYYYTDIYFYDENGVSISSTLINGNNIKVTIPTNTKYVSFSGRNGYPICEVGISI